MPQGNAAMVWMKGSDGVGGGPYLSRYNVASNQLTTFSLNTGTGSFINSDVHSLSGSVLMLGWSQISGATTHGYVSRIDLSATTAPQVTTWLQGSSGDLVASIYK